MLRTFLILLTAASWVYWVLAWWQVRRFFQRKQEIDTGFTPPVSILKPVKGVDYEAYENFRSFCVQDYPDFELLFAVSDKADTVIPIVQRLQQDFPERRIRLLVAPTTGPNHKAGLLHALSIQARHEVLLASDSDMRVTPDYLRRVVAPLADRHVGLVTCPYRGRTALTFTARLEALHMAVTFLPSVLLARGLLHMSFAMGASVTVRRSDLARIGGFAAVADYLADDYQLAARIVRLGLRIYFSNYITDSVLGATTFREQWDREVRWSHTNRVCQPWGYPGLLITFSTPLAIGVLLTSGLEPYVWLVVAGSLLIRWIVGWELTGYTQSLEVRRWLIWLPLRDMVTALVWCFGAAGQTVTWRGQRFVLYPDGRFQPLPDEHQASFARRPGPLAGMVRLVDSVLRRALRVYEFCHDDKCILRLALRRSDETLTLRDRTQIRQGDPVAELHFYNEHLPVMPTGGADLGWALAFQRRLNYSFRKLAAYAQDDPRLADVQAFRGEDYFGSRYGTQHMEGILDRWGFDLAARDKPNSLWSRFANFWASYYALALIWAFNPGSLVRRERLTMQRDHIWLSRRALLVKYGLQGNERGPAEANVVEQRALAQTDVYELPNPAAP